MTNVSFVRGLPSKSEKSGYRPVPAANKLDYAYMSEGELRLSLYRERLKILENYYPDESAYKATRQAIDQSLRDGLHVASLSGINSTEIRSFIRAAKNQNQPAINVSGGWFGFGSVETECREEIDNWKRAVVKHGSAGLFSNKKKLKAELERATKAMDDCTGLLQVQKVLNNHLEDGSHHVLYNFLRNANAVPQVVSSKYVNHRVAVQNFAKVSGLSQANIELWISNGVMRSNAKKGTQPFDPQTTIEIMATEIPESASVNGAFLVALPVIIKAIAAAATATALLIAQLRADKQNQLTANLQGMGLTSFGPEGPDWRNGQNQNDNNGGNEDYLPYLLLGGAALFLMSK